ncbi:MAG: sporulation protein, partial [Clostridia bacterium]|nr:sporulation protein [Clostridia bacterium]
MRGMIVSITQRRKWVTLLVCLAAGAILLWGGQAAATGVKRGLSLCGQLLIPSLFPFMILADFFIRSGLADSVGRRVDRAMRVLFGFSGCAAAAIVISMLGGYPAGALAVDRLVEQGELDRTTAKRLLRCC